MDIVAPPYILELYLLNSEIEIPVGMVHQDVYVNLSAGSCLRFRRSAKNFAHDLVMCSFDYT